MYEATLKTSEDTYTYIGLTGDTFKARYSAHKSSFKHEKYRTSTTLSQKIWELKESNIDYTLTWSILKKAHAYKGGGRAKCDLCLTEKLEILKRSGLKGCLNSRTELLSKCRHLRAFTLTRTVFKTWIFLILWRSRIAQKQIWENLDLAWWVVRFVTLQWNICCQINLFHWT